MDLVRRLCPICSKTVEGRADKVHCSPICKREAKRAYDRLHHLANRDRKIEAACKWQRANIERKREYDAQYRERTREKRLARKREYERERVAAADPAYRMSRRLASQKRRSRLSGSAVVKPRDIARQMHRQGDACAYCGTALIVPEIEHVVPIARGGRHSIGNIVLACLPCNRSKAHRTLMEWRLGKTVPRKSLTIL